MDLCKTHICAMTEPKTRRRIRTARAAKPRTVGRPEKPEAERLDVVPIRFPRPLLEAVDALARADIERPTRSVMVRRLVAEAIAARKGKP